MKKYIKGFNENLCCRGMQFEIGKTYEIENEGSLELCRNTVFHFCKTLRQVHSFYSVLGNNRFCEIEVVGELVEDDDKCGSNKIKIIREIKGEELNILLGKTNGNTGIFNTGNRNTGDFNTGYRNTGDFNTGDRNTGYRNTGDFNTGDRNTGDRNTGDRNTGYRNTGYRNTGDWNTGDWNTGYRNTGDWNTGYRNTGYWNTGNRNTGDWNTCNRSTGLFNTIEQNIMIFNKDTGMTYDEFRHTDMYNALYSSSFVLTEWIYYTDKEKENSPIRQAIGGYLKQYEFKEACANWWNEMSDENKELIKQIPNFDEIIFEEITGIKL